MLIALWLTPTKDSLSKTFSSPIWFERLVRRSRGRVAGSSSSIWSKLLQSGWEEVKDVAKAAPPWSSADRKPKPPILTGILACSQLASEIGPPNMQERPSLVMESKSCKRGVKVVVSVKSCLHVLGGGPDGARVSLPAQSHRPHLRLHLRGAAGHPPGADQCTQKYLKGPNPPSPSTIHHHPPSTIHHHHHHPSSSTIHHQPSSIIVYRSSSIH